MGTFALNSHRRRMGFFGWISVRRKRIHHFCKIPKLENWREEYPWRFPGLFLQCVRVWGNTVPLRQTRETLSGSERAFFPGKCKVSLVAPNILSSLHRGEGGGGRQSACRKIEKKSLVFFATKKKPLARSPINFSILLAASLATKDSANTAQNRGEKFQPA